MGASDCERVATGLLAQPVNAVTSLGFVLAGGVLIARALRAPQRQDLPARRAGAEPFTSARRSGAPPKPRIEPLVFGASVVATGLGSALYHGPQPSNADAVHDLSILAVLSQVAFYEVRYRLRDRPVDPEAFRLALASLGLGAVAFALGRTSSPLCDPGSPLQLHGVWHLLVALSLAAYGRARLENPSP
ncbi:MAG: hypothetical protein ACRDJT_01375 [Actinomycetota bacterium]